MPSARDLLGELADQALERTLGVVGSSRFSISLKTNYGPELTVYSRDGREAAPGGDAVGGGLGELVGFKGALIVRGAQGQVLTTIGDPPATDPKRLVVATVLVALLAFVIVRGFMPRP